MEDERSFKLHGLDHLTSPFPKDIEDWQAQIWEDILSLHYGYISEIDIEDKYSNLYAISRLTVSTSNVLSRFRKTNQGKTWDQQIKPFNFYLVGFQSMEENDKAVKPLSVFSSNPQSAVYEPFIDYETGEIKEGSHYFKPPSKTIMQYVDHPESKFDGEIGILERQHVYADGVIYIGKEANNIDDQDLDVKKAQEFVNKEDIMQRILAIPQKEAEARGVSRSVFQGIKQRIRESGDVNLDTPGVRRLIEALN